MKRISSADLKLFLTNVLSSSFTEKATLNISPMLSSLSVNLHQEVTKRV